MDHRGEPWGDADERPRHQAAHVTAEPISEGIVSHQRTPRSAPVATGELTPVWPSAPLSDKLDPEHLLLLRLELLGRDNPFVTKLRQLLQLRHVIRLGPRPAGRGDPSPHRPLPTLPGLRMTPAPLATGSQGTPGSSPGSG